MKLDFYTPSNSKNTNRGVINAGTSNDNVKFIPLDPRYKNPRFFARKFEKWPDQFEVTVVDDQISVRRSDVSVGGWGETLLIDVEFDGKEVAELPIEQKIPRVIYQTFETLDVPSGMFDAVNTWKKTNPDYEHYIYDAQSRIDFIEKFFDRNVLEAYLTLIPGAFKADLWRCCVLYQFGGVYADSDMICLQRMADVIEPNDEFIASRDDPMSKKFIANGFIASVPRHPFLLKQINSIVENVLERKEIFYLDITGPGLFGKSVNSVCGRHAETEYDLGINKVGSYIFKLLEHDWKTKTMRLGNTDVLYTEYPNKNSEMDTINNKTFYWLYKNNMVYKRIPRKIFSTSYDHLSLRSYMVESFKNKNKYWKFTHFTDDDCKNFFDKNGETLNSLIGMDVLNFYRSLSNGGEKSDFWRYCILYLEGGVYTDADTYCAVPMDNWVNHQDLILGIEAFLPLAEAMRFGMEKVGSIVGDSVVSVCNWTIAAAPRHEFIKNLIIDIIKNPVDGVLCNTGPGRLTKNAVNYFGAELMAKLGNEDISKNLSMVFTINKFGSNQSHSNAFKNYTDPFSNLPSDACVVHMFDGSWRTIKNKKINILRTDHSLVANMSLSRNGDKFVGVARYDEDFRRTDFMVNVGDCRSIVEINFNNKLEVVSETERKISNYPDIAKFEDSRFFSYKGKKYLSISFIDNDFNCWVGILDEDYKFLGKVNIDEYNRVGFLNKTKFWEKNWLFFERGDDLFFIYSTTLNYTVYKCVDFSNLKFEKYIDTKWPLPDNVPSDEFYFTAYLGDGKKVATAGSAGPIYLKDKNLYLYIIHTKFYQERKYNHYGVLLDSNLMPIKLGKIPIVNKYVPHLHLFISSIIENEDYFIISGGINDREVFTWEISKPQVYKLLGVA